MKTLKYLLLCFGLGASVSSFAASEIIVSQPSVESRYLVGAEETEYTKEYATAVALDAIRRIFIEGIQHLSKDKKSILREIERKQAAVECGFKYALEPNTGDKWSSHYVECVKSTGQITGDLNADETKGMGIRWQILSDKDKEIKDTKYYKKSDQSCYIKDVCYYPGPLAVLHWAMKNVGKVAVDSPSCENSTFLKNIEEILEMIEARKEIGHKAYIPEMDKRFKALQSIVDTCAKSKVNQNVDIDNLINQRLNDDGASKLGQVAFEEVNRAYGSKQMSEQKTKALALFVLENPQIIKLLQKNEGDLINSIDEMLEAYELILAKYVELNSTEKTTIRLSEKIKLAMATLFNYYMNDMHSFSQKKVEADPLKNAFKMGRVLGSNARTAEYNPEQRASERQKEQENRTAEFHAYRKQTAPQLTAGESPKQTLKTEGTKIVN